MVTKVALDDEIKDVLRDVCYDYDTEPRSYSGRGMYGEECLGFTVDSPGEFLLTLGMEIGRLNVEVVEHMIATVCTDDMGRRSIVYFPAIEAWEESLV